MHKMVEGFEVTDCRGSFRKICDVERDFKQCFTTHSVPNVFRGFHHYGVGNESGRLIHVLEGTLTDWIVDLRVTSPNFLKLSSIELREGDTAYLPWYVTHGYVTLTGCSLLYLFEQRHDPELDLCINFASFNIEFDRPFDSLVISDRDYNAAVFEPENHGFHHNVEGSW